MVLDIPCGDCTGNVQNICNSSNTGKETGRRRKEENLNPHKRSCRKVFRRTRVRRVICPPSSGRTIGLLWRCVLRWATWWNSLCFSLWKFLPNNLATKLYYLLLAGEGCVSPCKVKVTLEKIYLCTFGMVFSEGLNKHNLAKAQATFKAKNDLKKMLFGLAILLEIHKKKASDCGCDAVVHSGQQPMEAGSSLSVPASRVFLYHAMDAVPVSKPRLTPEPRPHPLASCTAVLLLLGSWDRSGSGEIMVDHAKQNAWRCLILFQSAWQCLIWSESAWKCLILSESAWKCLILLHGKMAWICLQVPDSAWCPRSPRKSQETKFALNDDCIPKMLRCWQRGDAVILLRSPLRISWRFFFLFRRGNGKRGIPHRSDTNATSPSLLRDDQSLPSPYRHPGWHANVVPPG